MSNVDIHQWLSRLIQAKTGTEVRVGQTPDSNGVFPVEKMMVMATSVRPYDGFIQAKSPCDGDAGEIVLRVESAKGISGPCYRASVRSLMEAHRHFYQSGWADILRESGEAIRNAAFHLKNETDESSLIYMSVAMAKAYQSMLVLADKANASTYMVHDDLAREWLFVSEASMSQIKVESATLGTMRYPVCVTAGNSLVVRREKWINDSFVEEIKEPLDVELHCLESVSIGSISIPARDDKVGEVPASGDETGKKAEAEA